MSGGQRVRLAGALSRYWPVGGDLVQRLPVVVAAGELTTDRPPRVEVVALPDWAADLGAGGGLLVPSAAIMAGTTPAFERTDWWRAAGWYLDGDAERAHERVHGPIHSYSILLSGWDARLWEHAWVNRIALLLRRAAARHFQVDEAATFGALPAADLVLTHDLDAVRKTVSIRIKQSAFDAFNAARAVIGGDAGTAARKIAHAARFAFGPGDYWTFDRLCRLEERHHVRSTFNVYAGLAGSRSARARLFDPGYDVHGPALNAMLRRLVDGGWSVGLHQSFEAWADAAVMQGQKNNLERALGREVTTCRQHWLRFSWAATWNAQSAAGLALDTTLGFNDRPGFRNGAALRTTPLDAGGRPGRLSALPLVLMDSHLYDYARPGGEPPAQGMAHWIDEIRAVRGTATLLWHPHVLSADYGWADGYEDLLRAVA